VFQEIGFLGAEDQWTLDFRKRHRVEKANGLIQRSLSLNALPDEFLFHKSPEFFIPAPHASHAHHDHSETLAVLVVKVG